MVNHSPKKISSLHHPLVKHLVKIRESRHYREKSQTVLVPGKKLVLETASFLSPHHVLATDEALLYDIPLTHLVTYEILKKITGLASPEGIAAEFPMPAPTPLHEKKFLLILDQINDPGNLGTLLRTALAFGWEGVILLPGCVDLFNEKVIRASRAACFRLPFQMGNWEQVLHLSQQRQIPLFLADLEGQPIDKVSPLHHAFLILSNEAQGVSKEAQQWGQKVTLPMSGPMESLNVGIAGGILMYLLISGKKGPE